MQGRQRSGEVSRGVSHTGNSQSEDWMKSYLIEFSLSRTSLESLGMEGYVGCFFFNTIRTKIGAVDILPVLYKGQVSLP